MTYKTILAIHSTDESITKLAPVVTLARTFDAHVDVLIISALTAMPPIIAMEVPSKVWREALTDLAKRCEECSDKVRSYFADEGVGVSVTVRAQQTSLINNAIATAAVYSDLVTMHRNESLVSGVSGHALEGALFDAGKPVLIFDQDAKEAPDKPEHALIAWDGSREVSRAVHHSLPILRETKHVQAFAIAQGDEAEIEQSLEELRCSLFRHHVKLDTMLIPREGQSTANAIIRFVNEQHPTLLIMGAYGQSKLREFVFSGTTRAALTHEMNTALFVAH